MIWNIIAFLNQNTGVTNMENSANTISPFSTIKDARKKLFTKLNTLKVKFPIITFFTYLTLIIVVLTACYGRFYKNMVNTYENLGSEILQAESQNIIIDHIPQYLSGNYDKEEYNSTIQKLNEYIKQYQSIYSLYAYKISDDKPTATVIFDCDTNLETGDALGTKHELESRIAKRITKFRNFEKVKPIIGFNEIGYFMTCSMPLIDSSGNCQGYLFIDFDLTEVRRSNLQFLSKLSVIVFFLMLIILYMGMKTVAVRITEPIEKMYLCLSSFKYNSDADRQENIRKLEALKIHTNREIQSLYEALLTTNLHSYIFMQEYRLASEQLDVASEMAYVDHLTGAGNKNAYENALDEYQKRLDGKESLKLAIMMADINNLKYVNDTFGHEKGDEYIKGCYKILSDNCRESRIYRIGGDEFVVLMVGNDYRRHQQIYIDIVTSYDNYFTDTSKDPWNRYSASIGVTELFSYDKKIVDAFKRADSAMYRAKSEFKEKNGRYR